MLNIRGIADLAEKNGNQVILFLANDTLDNELSGIEEWEPFAIGDSSSSVPGAGIFFYTYNMPLVLNSNIAVSIGLANGTFGRAKGFISDPTSLIYIIQDSNVYVVSKPPLCVFMEVGKPKHQTFDSLEPAVVPIFPTTFRVEFETKKGRKRNI